MKVIRESDRKYVIINGAIEGLEIDSYYDYHRNKGEITMTFIVNGVNMYKAHIRHISSDIILYKYKNTFYRIKYEISNNHYILKYKRNYSTDLKDGKNIFYHDNGHIYRIYNINNQIYNHKFYNLEYDDKGRLIESFLEYNVISFTKYYYIFTQYNYDNIDANYNGYITVKVNKVDTGRYECSTTKVRLIFNETKDKYKFEFECEES